MRNTITMRILRYAPELIAEGATKLPPFNGSVGVWEDAHGKHYAALWNEHGEGQQYRGERRDINEVVDALWSIDKDRHR